ncbi:hypothetical protein Tco_1435817, partial [Tanacetum coccineum]
VCPIVNAATGRLLGAYDLGVVTPRAVVHAGDKISGDARSWYMISGEAKSWVQLKTSRAQKKQSSSVYAYRKARYKKKKRLKLKKTQSTPHLPFVHRTSHRVQLNEDCI